MKNSIRDKYWTFRRKYLVMERTPDYVIPKYFIHMVEPFFIYWFNRIRWTPNQVTLLGAFSMVVGTVCMYFHAFYISALFFCFYLVLDCVDGGLARYQKSFSNFGKLLDRWTDSVLRLFLLFTLFYLYDVPLAFKIAFVITFALDYIIVLCYVVPYMRRQKLYRGKIKGWFFKRGIIPSYDIFWVYFTVIVCNILEQPFWMFLIIIVGKNLDWSYRLFEVLRTEKMIKQKRWS
ncbi:CDP-alcohol phosphatidyltransferase family protein [Aneurinibacillus migulanus]|uniref:CDP-alcohol phosphatidyltransferase family protein n=1 Tax=Aneurinibacillus migulanus TaxID=47500 RepID=UPI002E1B510F|nr:CDP-alcohol phosphatidyltransferase family protein [Aneurinibacillus migulanus]MED4730254.1 CDP-alcohol phosphatidyltransferase family protein [Aneurinibacillus migulanus]